ncbi:MAG: hypothetical protein HY851_00655 [candidate division Zixibacteria bacterium]|nr:hypothetical protein [candidate division Zixibacteria bacterium]
MLKKLSDTTATSPLGSTTGHKLFRIESGPHAGRLAALYATGSGEIQLVWSDPPYQSWSSPQTLVSDCGYQMFDALMDAPGSLSIAYTDQATSRLVFRRVAFSAGVWTVGTKVAVYDGAEGYDPCLALGTDGKIWVAWRRLVIPSSWIHVKSSADNGAVWGSGPTDPGDQLAGPVTAVWCKLIVGTTAIHAVIAYDATAIVIRSLSLGGGSWSAETNIFSGSGVTGDFDVALTDSGGLAIVLCDPQPKYREFDGFTWSAVQTLDTRPASSPQVHFRNGMPVIAFISGLGFLQNALMYTARLSGSFQPPAFVDPQARTLDRVLLYRESSATYHDATSAAADSTGADVYHPQSGALLAQVGDKLYAGLNDRFRFLTVVLSTVGAGGSVSYSYWDGSGWTYFTPNAGAINLTAVCNQIKLWADYQGIPQNWQKCSVNADRRFWIRIEVASSFSTPPVGSQITSMSDLRQIITRR